MYSARTSHGSTVTADRHQLLSCVVFQVGICLGLFLAFATSVLAQTAGQNVNMVSGTTWPYGDPFLERQDEPSIAVSTRNPQHLLAGANDYRSVDLNLEETEPGDSPLTNIASGEPWVGQYISIDGGARWQSTLLPGFPQDTSRRGMSSPLHGFTTAADPVLASGTNGMFYYGGIAFNRGSSLGLVFVARFMDLNNKENGTVSQDSFPIRYINTVPVAYGTISPSQFLDKPAIAVDIPRGTNTCSFSVTQSDGTAVQQKIPAGNVYVAYADVVTATNGTQTSTIYFSRSTNCGSSWSAPIAISKGIPISQGATIQVDPETGIVYVAWRIIHSATHPNDGIAIAASLNGGQSFFPPVTLVSLPPFNFATPTAPAFFDQGTTYSSFRTTAYPALAVADSGISLIPGPLYLAWSQRGVGLNGEARIMMLAIPGNAGFTSSGFKPPTPFPVDNGAVTNDLGGTFSGLTSGHQIMPTMTFNQGKLMVLYYDLRQDHTEGEFTPSVSADGLFVPDPKGNFFEESRNQVAEDYTPAYSPFFISDAGLQVRRHTLDVVLAQSNFAFVPQFTYTRVSHYDLGLFEGETGGETAPFHQLKYDPPNLPMFEKGQASFMGDYIGIAGQPFVLVKCGSSQCWTYNNPSPPGVAGTFLAAPKPAPMSAVHYAGFTSNQDVLPPFDNNWANYTPIATGTSVYDPTQTVTGCTPGQYGNEGDRNQNVYVSRITQGLVVSSPQVSKPLSSGIQRGFVLLLENRTGGRSTPAGPVNYFRLNIANQPVNGFASFAQFVPPSPVPPPPFPASNNGITFPLKSVDVAIAPHTGVARTIFAVSSNPTASILVNVNEIDSLGGKIISGGLSGLLLFNADGTVPTNLVDPNGQTGANSITNVELYNPNVGAPNVGAPNVGAPNVAAPNVGAPNVGAPNVGAPNVGACSITNPNVGAPNVAACGVGNPNVGAYGVANPNVAAPNVAAPNVGAAPPSDATYTVTNPSGNTNTTLSVSLTGNSPVPLQLLVSQFYMTPQTDGQCHLVTQQQNITLSNVPNAAFTSINQLSNPNVGAAPVTEPTFSLGPGDTAYITIRGQVDIATMEQIVTQVAPVIQPVAVNSNNTTATTPPFFAPVFITTASLPDGLVNTAYSSTVQVIGGKPPYQWTASNVPAGLSTTVSTDTTTLVISGSPSASNLPGTPITFQVTDSEGTASQTATRTLSLRIANTLVVTNSAQLPTGVQGVPYPPFSFSATGGIPNITWTLQSGSLDGLVLGADGTLSGTPAQTGTFSFVVLATDSASPDQTQLFQGSLTVVPVNSNVVFATQPSNAIANQAIAPAVRVQVFDNTHAVIPGANVTLKLNSGPGTLSGTLTQITDATGTATFANLSISSAGNGDTLQASAGNFITISNQFNITTATAAACSPIPGNTIGWYPFNGNALDIRGGRPGSLHGTGGQFVAGEVGQGFQSGGEGSVITVPAAFLDPVNFTVGAWIKINSISNDPTMQIVWQGDSVGTDLSTPYSLSVQGNGQFSASPGAIVVGQPAPGKVLAIVTDFGHELDIFSNTVLQPGVFYYVALTWNGPVVGATLYVNGVPENSGGGPIGVFAGQYQFQIGGILNGTVGSFNGVIDELQVWGSALTQFQISNIYNANSAGECQALWFTEIGNGASKIGLIAPDGNNASSDFSTPTAASSPFNVVTGPDGNLWFTENIPNKIGQLVYLGGGAAFQEYQVPPTFGSGGPIGITAGPDENLWFTESAPNSGGTNYVGSITTSGSITLYPVPTLNSTPWGITSGPDGNLWFTEFGSGFIGKLSTTGSITEYDILLAGTNPSFITTGSDGNLWITESSHIAVVSPAGTLIAEYPTPTANSGPYGITLGPDGNVWFTESATGVNKIGRITPAGTITEFPVPGEPRFIAAGPDGNLWFTDDSNQKIGRITTTGTVTEFLAPTTNSGPWGITLGPGATIQAPAPPTNVNSTLNAGGAPVISWNASTSAGVVSYNVYRATKSGGPYTLVGNTTATTFTDNNAGSCTTFYYVVTAVGAGNTESVNSNETNIVSGGPC